ncbi:hypothetical protein C8R45DRAFT_1103117 [Mycena sanguinolenta]|nr:hypothetical protein C8R45DRAFT_1103117 [Mycena sanguinolenta]
MDVDTAPIHRLLPELMLIIFLWAWTLPEPLRWTSLLLGSPAFWTDISVTPAYRPAYIQAVLTRSAARHLSSNLRSNSLYLRDIRRLFHDHFGRIRRLTVDCYSSEYWNPFGLLMREYDWSCLEQLAVFVSMAGNFLSIERPPLHTLDASFLGRLTLLSELALTSHWVLSPPVSPITTLRTLRLSDFRASGSLSWSSFAAAIRAFPSLQILELGMVHWRDVSPHDSPLLLLNLRVLHVAVRGPRSQSMFDGLALFRMPNLKTVRLFDESDDLARYTFAFRDVLSRVAHVELSLHDPDPDDLYHFVSELSSVRTLAFTGLSYRYSEFFSMVDGRWPRLRMLTLLRVNVPVDTAFVDSLCQPDRSPFARGFVVVQDLRTVVYIYAWHQDSVRRIQVPFDLWRTVAPW